MSIAPLISQPDLTYIGAFRVPSQGAGTTTSLYYGGTALAYWPAHDSLLLIGHDQTQLGAEITIPTPTQGVPVTSLPRALLVQGMTDLLQGKRLTVDGGIGSGVKIGGIAPVGNALVVTAWTYYDGSPTPQTKTHFVTGQDFASLTPASVTGPFQVGTGFQAVVPSDVKRIGGFVSGYMAPIPLEWQSALGGTHLTGQGGRISIVTRTSSGPSATVFTPADLGSTQLLPAHLLMGYPDDPGVPGSLLAHPTLGRWDEGGFAGLYDGSEGFRGMVFPDGTRSILFFGWEGTHPPPNYGVGTTNPALDGTIHSTNPLKYWRYDPVVGNQNQGLHGYPYHGLCYAYNVEDFIAVKNGTLAPWDVVPYATWTFTLPFQQKLNSSGVDIGNYEILGAAWDAGARRLFLSTFKSDGNLPLIHVFQVP